MTATNDPVTRLAVALHHRLLWLLAGGYVAASVAPGPGLWLRSLQVGPAGSAVPLPAVLLAFLLFNAGLGVTTGSLRDLVHRPGALMAGLAANLLLPVAFILGAAGTLQLWHNPREVQEILVGLAVIASMPVAGSSTTWVQNREGDLSLSVGLVVLSTSFSPLTTPLVLQAVGWVAEGEYADALRDLAAGGAGSFLVWCVLAPSLAGIAARAALGERRAARLRPGLKLSGTLVLLTLCYANAAVALPQVVRQPDWDFLGVMLAVVAAMCGAGFAAGAGVGRLLRVPPSQRVSLTFGLGMTNNGTGLVVAAGSLAHLPNVLLPILFYNLVQHFVAGLADRMGDVRVSLPAKSTAALPVPASAA